MHSSCLSQAFAASCHQELTVRGHVIRAESGSWAHNAVVGCSALDATISAALGLQLSPLGIPGQSQNIVCTLIVINHLAEEATLGIWVFLPLQQTLTRLNKMQQWRFQSDCCNTEGATTEANTHMHTHTSTSSTALWSYCHSGSLFHASIIALLGWL